MRVRYRIWAHKSRRMSQVASTRLIPINVRQVLSAIESESQRNERGGNIIAGDENKVKR